MYTHCKSCSYLNETDYITINKLHELHNEKLDPDIQEFYDVGELSVVTKKTLPKKNIFILDFDDTLFPTTFINKKNEVLDIIKAKKTLNTIMGETIINFINEIKKYSSDIYIITNASYTWLDTSMKAWLDPEVSSVFNNIIAVSARDYFYESFKNDYLDNTIRYNTVLWKFVTMKKVLENHMNNFDCTLISIGDSSDEKIATQKLAIMYNIHYKTFKLIHSPSMVDIREQQKILIENMKTIVDNKNSMDSEMRNNKG